MARYKRVKDAANTEDVDIIESEVTNDINEWIDGFNYLEGDEFTAQDPDTSKFRIYRVPADLAAGGTFDETERDRYEDLGGVRDVVNYKEYTPETAGTNVDLDAAPLSRNYNITYEGVATFINTPPDFNQTIADAVMYDYDHVGATAGILTLIQFISREKDTFKVWRRQRYNSIWGNWYRINDSIEEITGQYIGSASVFGNLPTTDSDGNSASNGDWAILNINNVGTGTTESPQYLAGIYVYDGTTYSLAKEIKNFGTLSQAQVESGTNTIAGTVTGERLKQSFHVHNNIESLLNDLDVSTYESGRYTLAQTAASINFPTGDESLPTRWVVEVNSNASGTVRTERWHEVKGGNAAAKGVYFVRKRTTGDAAMSAFERVTAPTLTTPQAVSTTGADYTEAGMVSAERLDEWGVSRRVQRVFNVSGGFDFEALGYSNKTAVYVRNIDPVNGLGVTYGAGGANTLEITHADGTSEVIAGQDTFNVQPSEIVFMERDGTTVHASIIPGERVVRKDTYATANADGPYPHDAIVQIRSTGELFFRRTGTNNIDFPADGQANADWWKIGAKDPQSLILNYIEVGLRSSGTNASSNIELTFVDLDGNNYPDGDWVYSADLTQYAGGSATIVTDKALYTGIIGLGRNKQGTVKFYYTGDFPNGLSAIVVDSNIATVTEAVDVTYQGTNYHDAFAAIGDIVDPLHWTTARDQTGSDQAAPFIEATEYLADSVFSAPEPDAADADYGTWFNWRVNDGETIADTEVPNGTEAEFLAIKPKLTRFGIGTASKGTDDRVIDTAGIMGLDPLNSLSNTDKSEFIHWTVVNQPLTVRMLPAPSFVTKWIDYSGNNIVQPTAANEDFVIPAGVQMWVHRVGNAVSVVFEPSEGGGGGLKRITLDPDDAVFADTTIDIDYTAYEGQQFESELFVIGERTITFNAPTLPTGADRKTLIHRVFINANTADVTVTFPAGTWRNADTADDATDIVIPAGENRTLELTTLDNDGNEYVRVLGSGGSNIPMVGGYIYSAIDVANSSFGSGAISFNSSSFNTIYDPKGLVDAGGTTITIDSPEKAGAYMMALNVTSGTSGGAVVARVNGVNRLTARGEDGADSDAAVGVIELNEGDVVTISVVSGNTTYGVSFTMSQVTRFVDETQFVAADQIVAVQDNTRIVVTGFGPAGGTATTDITTFTVPEDGDYEYETNVEGFQSSVLAWNKTLQVRDAAGGGGNLIMSQALTMGASATTAVRKMANPEFGTVTLQAGVTYTTRLVHANEFTDQLSPVTLILRKVPKTVEALDTNLIPANTTEVGTPLNAGSTREYTLQWDGTKIVNTLSTEKWTTGNIEYIINHLTRHMTVLGFQNITSSGSVNWTEAFADTDYTFAHDIRESGSERGIISVNTRTATSITYTLYDNVGTGDAGSVIHFAITGRI